MNDNSSTISRYNLTFTADRIRELRVGVTKIKIDHHWNRGINIFRKNDVANHIVGRPRFALKTPNQNCFYAPLIHRQIRNPINNLHIIRQWYWLLAIVVFYEKLFTDQIELSVTNYERSESRSIKPSLDALTASSNYSALC